MREFTEEQMKAWHDMVGKRVWKNRGTDVTTEPKPFKSGRKVNTVKAVVAHDHTTNLAFTFEEDNSQVECFRCSLAPELAMPVLSAGKVDDNFVQTFMREGIILRG